MSELLSVIVPFSGFYETIHADWEDISRYCFQDDRGDVIDEIANEAFELIDFSVLRPMYAKEYTERFANEFEIKMEFETLDSPLSFNYTTDRIFAKISIDEVKRLYNEINMKELRTLIKERFSNRSGFISHYPNDLSKWDKDLALWDHNQLSCILECVARENMTSGEFEMLDEFDLMESAISNNFYEELVFNSSDEEKMSALYDKMESIRESMDA